MLQIRNRHLATQILSFSTMAAPLHVGDYTETGPLVVAILFLADQSWKILHWTVVNYSGPLFKVWSHKDFIIFNSMRICVVQLRCHRSEIVTILNEFNQSLERKKSLSWLVYVLKKNFPPGQEILCLFNSCAATAKKSDRKACSACRVMFCLLNFIAYLLLCLRSLKWNQSNRYKLPFYGLQNY